MKSRLAVNWLKSWGEPGDGPGQFNTSHSIAVDAQGASSWPTAVTVASTSPNCWIGGYRSWFSKQVL